MCVCVVCEGGLFSSDIHFFDTICHVYRCVWPAREATCKPHSGAPLKRSVHDCETHVLFLLFICFSFNSYTFNTLQCRSIDNKYGVNYL